MAEEQGVQLTFGQISEVSEEEARSLSDLKPRAPVSAEVATLRRQLANLPDNQVFKFEVSEGTSMRGIGRSLSFAARHHGKMYIPRGVRENTIYFMLQPADETAMELRAEPQVDARVAIRQPLPLSEVCAKWVRYTSRLVEALEYG